MPAVQLVRWTVRANTGSAAVAVVIVSCWRRARRPWPEVTLKNSGILDVDEQTRVERSPPTVGYDFMVAGCGAEARSARPRRSVRLLRDFEL